MGPEGVVAGPEVSLATLISTIMAIKLVWTDNTLSIFKETPVIPPLDYPYERPVKRKFQKSLVFLCL